MRSSHREVYRRKPIGAVGAGVSRILHMSATPVSSGGFHRLCSGRNLSSTGNAISDYTLDKWDKKMADTHYQLSLPRRTVVGWGQSYAIAKDTLNKNGNILYLDSKKACEAMAKSLRDQGASNVYAFYSGCGLKPADFGSDYVCCATDIVGC